MEMKKIICTVCPKGCLINTETENGQITGMTGYGCKKGAEYAAAECTNPVRTLTTTVRVKGGRHPVAPVKSQRPVPRELLVKCVNEINKCIIEAPVKTGDIIIADILGTGVDIIATSNIGAWVGESPCNCVKTPVGL